MLRSVVTVTDSRSPDSPSPPVRQTPPVTDRFADRLRQRQDSLSPSLQKVAEYLRDNRHAVLSKSALEIALETGTSDATVIRTVQALGFSGLVDLKETFQDYLGLTASPSQKMAVTTGEFDDGVGSAIDFVGADTINAVSELGSVENRQGMTDIVRLLAGSQRIGVFGIGASGILATYASRLFSRSGYPSYALNQTGIALAESLLTLQDGDALLMMAHGRAHREAQAVLAEAERLSIPVAMLITQKKSVLLRQAACAVVIPRAKSNHVALHGPMLICIETIMLGLASVNPAKTVATLDRLVGIRDIIRPRK